MASQNLIEVRELSKSYGPVRALDRVSFDVREGAIMGFLGPNGAGKSTTLRILAGFLPGDRGAVRVGGYDVRSESLAVRSVIGYLPEGVPLYPEMRVSEYLKFRSRLKGISFRDRRSKIGRALDATGIGDVHGRVIGTLSRGYRQRVGLADALLNEPKVLILDEPTVGLDPEQVRQFRTLLAEVGRDRTVILSTHILQEVELVCSDVVIISQGRIAERDRAENLRKRFARQSCVVVELDCPRKVGLEGLGAMPGVSSVEIVETSGSSEDIRDGGDARFRRFRVFGATDEGLAELVYQEVKRRDWTLRHLERESLSLEDVFLDVVGKSDGQGSA